MSPLSAWSFVYLALVAATALIIWRQAKNLSFIGLTIALALWPLFLAAAIVDWLREKDWFWRTSR